MFLQNNAWNCMILLGKFYYLLGVKEMKKLVLLMSLVVSAFVLVGCANQGTNATSADASANTAPAHHDYKGEMDK